MQGERKRMLASKQARIVARGSAAAVSQSKLLPVGCRGLSQAVQGSPSDPRRSKAIQGDPRRSKAIRRLASRVEAKRLGAKATRCILGGKGDHSVPVRSKDSCLPSPPYRGTLAFRQYTLPGRPNSSYVPPTGKTFPILCAEGVAATIN